MDPTDPDPDPYPEPQHWAKHIYLNTELFQNISSKIYRLRTKAPHIDGQRITTEFYQLPTFTTKSIFKKHILEL